MRICIRLTVCRWTPDMEVWEGPHRLIIGQHYWPAADGAAIEVETERPEWVWTKGAADDQSDDGGAGEVTPP